MEHSSIKINTIPSRYLSALRHLVSPKLLYYVSLPHPSQKLNRTDRGATNFKLPYPSLLHSPSPSPWVFVLCPKNVLFFFPLSSGSQEYWMWLEEITSYNGNILSLRQLTTYVTACTHSLDCCAIFRAERVWIQPSCYFSNFMCCGKKTKLAIFHFCEFMRITEYFLHPMI